MNHRRFHFGNDIGARMLREAESIEVKLYKINGAVQATFELHGCLADAEGDDEFGVPHVARGAAAGQADARRVRGGERRAGAPLLRGE
jgi:hypothetical protein